MDTEADFDRAYSEAVRHMSDAQVAHIESGAFCDSIKMHYAQQCYHRLVTRDHSRSLSNEHRPYVSGIFHHPV